MKANSEVCRPAIDRDWCRIVQIDGVSVLFFEEFNSDEDQHQINAMVNTDGAMFSIKVTSSKPFSQSQFNDFATKAVARSAILQACRFGLEPVVSPDPIKEDEPC